MYLWYGQIVLGVLFCDCHIKVKVNQSCLDKQQVEDLIIWHCWPLSDYFEARNTHYHTTLCLSYHDKLSGSLLFPGFLWTFLRVSRFLCIPFLHHFKIEPLVLNFPILIPLKKRSKPLLPILPYLAVLILEESTPPVCTQEVYLAAITHLQGDT